MHLPGGSCLSSSLSNAACAKAFAPPAAAGGVASPAPAAGAEAAADELEDDDEDVDAAEVDVEVEEPALSSGTSAGSTRSAARMSSRSCGGSTAAICGESGSSRRDHEYRYARQGGGTRCAVHTIIPAAR